MEFLNTSSFVITNGIFLFYFKNFLIIFIIAHYISHSQCCFCRCKIEQEYAQKLRRLTKNYLPKQKGDDYKFTGIKAFSLMLNEINDLAGQHELIAENLSTAVVSDLTTLIRSLKDDRRKQLQVIILFLFDYFVRIHRDAIVW